MYQYWFMSWENCVWGGGNMGTILSAQFFYKSKIFLQLKPINLKKEYTSKYLKKKK